MEFQSRFEVSIDVPENILALCPTCHREFHFGQDDSRKKLLTRFLSYRAEALALRGISIDIETLESFYGKE